MKYKISFTLLALMLGLGVFIGINGLLYSYYQYANRDDLKQIAIMQERVTLLEHSAADLQEQIAIADNVKRQELERSYADDVQTYNLLFEQYQLMLDRLPPRYDLLLWL